MRECSFKEKTLARELLFFELPDDLEVEVINCVGASECGIFIRIHFSALMVSDESFFLEELFQRFGSVLRPFWIELAFPSHDSDAGDSFTPTSSISDLCFCLGEIRFCPHCAFAFQFSVSRSGFSCSFFLLTRNLLSARCGEFAYFCGECLAGAHACLLGGRLPQKLQQYAVNCNRLHCLLRHRLLVCGERFFGG